MRLHSAPGRRRARPGLRARTWRAPVSARQAWRSQTALGYLDGKSDLDQSPPWYLKEIFTFAR